MRVLAFQPIGAKSVLVARLVVLDLEEQRRAAIPVPHGLPEIAAFRMRPKLEVGDDLVCGQRSRHG